MTSIFDPMRLGAVSLDVMNCGRATPDALAARQKTRLTLLLNAAVQGSRFYREQMCGASPDTTQLSDLPIVSRGALMARFDDWVTDPQLKLKELQAFTADPQRIGESYLNKYLVWESSGTSNEPGIFVQDVQTLTVYDALESVRRSAPRPMQRWFDPLLLAERIAFVGAIGGHFSSIVTMLRLRQVNPLMAQRLRCFSIMQSTKAMIDELNTYAPTVIATYPTVAVLLAEEFSRGHLKFKPQEIWTGGETLTPAARQRVEQVLGCAVRNSYGASEFMSIGWECSHGHMHVNSDWVILEPVDEQGQPLQAGQPASTTLLTNLANHVQPLIRYDLGDQVTVFSGRCACGSSLPVIEVQGRRDDSLVMTGCDGDSVTLLPLALTTVLEDDAGMFDFQLCQLNDHTLVLGLGVCGAEAEIAADRCRLALTNFAMSQGLAPIQLVVELGQAACKGRSGKVKRIVAQTDPTKN